MANEATHEPKNPEANPGVSTSQETLSRVSINSSAELWELVKKQSKIRNRASDDEAKRNELSSQLAAASSRVEAAPKNERPNPLRIRVETSNLASPLTASTPETRGPVVAPAPAEGLVSGQTSENKNAFGRVARTGVSRNEPIIPSHLKVEEEKKGIFDKFRDRLSKWIKPKSQNEIFGLDDSKKKLETRVDTSSVRVTDEEVQRATGASSATSTETRNTDPRVVPASSTQETRRNSDPAPTPPPTESVRPAAGPASASAEPSRTGRRFERRGVASVRRGLESLPQSERDQYVKYREMLDYVELNGTNDNKGRYFQARLNEALEGGTVNTELASEIEARLRLLYTVKQIVPNINDNPDRVAQVLEGLAGQESNIIRGVDFTKLLKTDLVGLNVHDAFMLIQQASIEGLVTENAQKIRLNKKGNTSEQNSSVKRAIMDRLIFGGLTPTEAKKSFELAWNVAKCSFETSTWNPERGNNDSVSKLIYFREFRKDTGNPLNAIGPNSTVDHIPTLIGSLFRWSKIVDNNGNKISMIKEGDLRNGRNVRDETYDIFRRGYIEPRDLDFDRMPETIFADFAKAIANAGKLSRLLIESDWGPGKLSESTLDDISRFSFSCDPDNQLSLKYYFAYGLVDQIGVNASKNDKINSGYVDNLLNELCSDVHGIITQQEMEEIKRDTKIFKRVRVGLAERTFRRAGVSVLGQGSDGL